MIKVEIKYHYRRNFKLSLIVSLVISIICFLYFPVSYQEENKILFSNDNIISFDNIPVTVQNTPGTFLSKPKTPLIFSTQKIIEPELLDNVEIKNEDFAAAENSSGLSDEKLNQNNNAEASILPFKPRQIFEVVPLKNDNFNGMIKLSLKIDTTGKVINYIVVKNTVNNKNCLENVISAASKSRWQPAELNGKKVEYWVEKSYTFN